MYPCRVHEQNPRVRKGEGCLRLELIDALQAVDYLSLFFAGKLVHLVTFDVSHNHLEHLPAGMYGSSKYNSF